MAGVGLAWSRRGDRECLVVTGAPAGSRLAVRPAWAGGAVALPEMAGAWVPEDAALLFVPQFGFLDGERYTLSIDGEWVAELARPSVAPLATGEVLAVYPSAPVVPRNLLRLYVWFSVPMTDGVATRHVRLLDDDGRELADALLAVEYELWDAAHRRLTLLLDPARIKRGLLAHRAVGYALELGRTVRLVVDEAFPDASGAPLRVGSSRTYLIGEDERRLIDVTAWRLHRVAVGTSQPLHVDFDRLLDHGLASRCLRIETVLGARVRGKASIGAGERRWSFEPSQPWGEPCELVVDPILEDVAGNSLYRVFDGELGSPDARCDDPVRRLAISLDASRQR